MRCFAGFILEGEAAEWHNTLTQDLAQRFGITDLSKRLPPHITLYYTPKLEDAEPLKSRLHEWAASHGPVELTMKGFGCFGEKSVYADVEATENVREDVGTIRQSLRELEPESGPFNTFPWCPHASLARWLEGDTADRIMEYLSTFPPRDFPLVFDKIALMRLEGSSYVVEEEFSFKR